MNIVKEILLILYVIFIQDKMTDQKTITSFNLDKYLIAAGFIGPIIFFLTVYFLFALIFPGYNIVNQYIGELGAIDSPIKTITNVFGFSLFGILIMIFAFGVYRSNEINKFGKLAAIFFLLTGILMFFVGIFICDTGCNNFSIRGDLHEKASNYQFPILAIGLIIFALSVSRHPRLKFLTPIILVLGIITLILSYYLFFVHNLPYLGILQRSAIGLPYIIMIIIAVSIYRVQFSKSL